jgi:hypothetical protein
MMPTSRTPNDEKESRSFLKKRTKKLLLILARAGATSVV